MWPWYSLGLSGKSGDVGGETLDGLQLAAICGQVGPVRSRC